MPITPLPTPVPSRADPANFAVRADAFLAALPTFATEANALEANVDAAEAVCLSVAQTVNVTAWSSVTSYVVGANVYDATTLLTYRRKTAGSGGLRPGLNGTDWQLLTGFGDVDTVSDQTIGGVKTFSNAIGVASGGTGASTAAAAFAAIKQAATDSATGVVELATAAEAQAGTDATRSATPASLGATVIGMGQAWQNFSGSRSSGVTYTNSTGRTIQVVVTATSSGATGTATAAVGGVTIHSNAWGSSVTSPQTISFLVPPGATYVVTLGGYGTPLWSELR